MTKDPFCPALNSDFFFSALFPAPMKQFPTKRVIGEQNRFFPPSPPSGPKKRACNRGPKSPTPPLNSYTDCRFIGNPPSLTLTPLTRPPCLPPGRHRLWSLVSDLISPKPLFQILSFYMARAGFPSHPCSPFSGLFLQHRLPSIEVSLE